MPPTATTTTQPPSPPTGAQRLGRRVAETSTPSRLSLLRALAIVLAVVFTVAGAFGVNRRADAINDVRNAARRLLALQDIRVRVVHADAIASSSYLVGGLEDPAQRAAYLEEIGRAGDGLVAVSGAASDADISELSVASRLLGSYVGLVEQARASNRQGFPVGAAYQRQANGIVTNVDPDVPDIVSSLRTVEAAQRDGINSGLATAHRAGVWLQLSGWLLMLALVVGAAWLARTFRRVVNVPLTAAILGLLLVLVIGGWTQARAMGDADTAVREPLAAADRAAQARAAAFEARSQEALTLINRGNGAANEASWQRADDVVTTALDGQSEAAVGAYANYADAHTEIRRLDDSGDWDAAVAVSLGKATQANAVVPFDQFDQLVSDIATGEGSRASTDLGEPLGRLRTLRNVVFLAGLALAVLAALGYGQRLKEYR